MHHHGREYARQAWVGSSECVSCSNGRFRVGRPHHAPRPPARRPHPPARAPRSARDGGCPDSDTTTLPAGTSASRSNVRWMSTLKSSRLRLLIPITSESSSSARSSSSSSWISTSASRSSSCACANSSASRALLERADHEQHRVRARDLRLVELVRVDREVLAQDRQLGGGARLAQVRERPAEVRLLGEDRDRRRAAALVGDHDVRAAPAVADRPRRGRAALVLRDHRRAGTRQRLRERAPLAARLHLGGQIGQRALSLAAAHGVARGVPRARRAAASCGRLHPALEHAARRRPSRRRARQRARPPRACPRRRAT